MARKGLKRLPHIEKLFSLDTTFAEKMQSHNVRRGLLPAVHEDNGLENWTDYSLCANKFNLRLRILVNVMKPLFA